jgi:Holliday junction resolvasome RuvABC endonuclease subunit
MTEKVNYRIFSIDPGLRNLGWSVIDYNIKKGTETVYAYGTLTAKSLLKAKTDEDKLVISEFGERYFVLSSLEIALNKMFSMYGPDYVCCEGAFAHKFIDAFSVLVLIIHLIRRLSHKHVKKNIVTIAPREVKKCISNSGGSDKDTVQYCVLNNKDIIIRDTKANPIKLLTEHEADAIAIGHTFIKIYLDDLILAESVRAKN